MWMQALDDIALLREFAEHDSELAFAEIVARHVGKVYSVALRHTRNPHQAEDITQAVFVIFARKARSFSRRVVLSGWLYQTARLTAVTFIRGEIRRAQREQEAIMQTSTNANEPDFWPQIAPLLDEALAGLGEKDRNAVVLRFFDGKSMKDVGSALGGSEDAAKMRVNRAVEKLRSFFSIRGVALSGAAIVGTVSANSVQAAPAGLAKSATFIAMAKGSMTTASISTLVKGTMKIMTWIKVKTAIGVAAAGLLVAGTATVTVSTLLRAEESSAPAPEPVIAQAPPPAKLISPPPVSPEQPALAVAPQPPVSPKVMVSSIKAQPPSKQPVYPIAPMMSQILAALRAANGGAGLVVIPPDLYLHSEYDNLFQKLNLTPDQIAAFIRIMEDKQTQEGNFMRANQLDPATLAGLDAGQIVAAQQEHFQQMQTLMQPIDQAADAQIKQLLGSDANYSDYQTYNAQQKERAVVMNGYRGGLDAEGVAPLTLDEDEQLVNLFYQARIAANSDADVEAQQLPQIMRQAATFLTADQVNVLTQYTRSLVSSPMTTEVGGAIGVVAPN